MSNNTTALDILTMAHAISTLNEEIETTWWEPNGAGEALQERFFALLEKLEPLLSHFDRLNAMASRNWNELNDFLVEHGFDPMFSAFDPDTGIGVASILDMLVEWLHGASILVDIETDDGVKPGFLLAEGVKIFQLEGDEFKDSFLLQLLTKSGDSVWILDHSDLNLGGLDMVELALRAMSAERWEAQGTTEDGYSYPLYKGAKIPMLEIDTKPELDWMLRAIAHTTSEPYWITQAFQQFKLRMNSKGARVKVATGFAVESFSAGYTPPEYVVNGPFYLWFTQGVEEIAIVPIAVACVGYESMKEPEGSLEDL